MRGSRDYLEAVQSLNVYRRGDRRAPHKPLLLLLAIANLQQGKRDVEYRDIEESLRPLLDAYAPPIESGHQPQLPYWHLQSDGLWVVSGAADLPLRKGNFPRMDALRSTTGRLPDGFADMLDRNPAFLRSVVVAILEHNFEESLHQDILRAVGLTLPFVDRVAEPMEYSIRRRPRDPRFRDNVLRAYEHRCAATGFQAALKGRYFGCEAAHIRWHAYEGPDLVENGFAVEPTLHKLFDAGAWTLTDDCRILVSAEFTGGEEATTRVRGLHGKRLRPPIRGEPRPSIRFIRWHRERDMGGVFKTPALPL